MNVPKNYSHTTCKKLFFRRSHQQTSIFLVTCMSYISFPSPEQELVLATIPLFRGQTSDEIRNQVRITNLKYKISQNMAAADGKIHFKPDFSEIFPYIQPALSLHWLQGAHRQLNPVCFFWLSSPILPNQFLHSPLFSGLHRNISHSSAL